MLVVKNDFLVRTKDNVVFRVILADAQEFVVCRMRFDAKKAEWISDYAILQAYSNAATSLEVLGFTKTPKNPKFDEGKLVA